MPTSPNSITEERPRAFLLAWAATLAAAMLATLPLWTPLRDTPRIVPWGGLTLIPPGIDFGLIVVLALGVGRAAFSEQARPRSLVMAAAALAAQMALDQLRWQPWAYHALIAAIVLTDTDTRRALSRLRWIAVAVYAYSAIAKLDAEFARTLGSQMLEVLGKPFGMDPASLGEPTRYALALSLPLGELAVAVLLAVAIFKPQLGRSGALAAVAMHLVTIWVLGPWGLFHSFGVLVWNVGFAWQTAVLFGLRQREPTSAPVKTRAPLGLAATAFAVVMPLLTIFGWWDQWPGWALYAPRGERAALFVHEDAVEFLPSSLQQHVERSDEGPWRRVGLAEWVLAEANAPIYPQNRIVAALSLGLAKRSPLEGRYRLVEETAADRWSRHRDAVELSTTDEIRRSACFGLLSTGVSWTRAIRRQ